MVGSAANRIASLVQPDPDTHVSLPVGHRRLHSFTYDGSAHRFFLRALRFSPSVVGLD